jgi:hypothetical protein
VENKCVCVCVVYVMRYETSVLRDMYGTGKTEITALDKISI